MTKKMLLALIISAIMNPPAVFSAPGDVVKKVRSGVVTINVYNKDRQLTGRGNGFFVSGNGEIITNYHVMKDAYYSEIYTAKGTKYPITSIIAENPYKDLIKVKAKLPPSRIVPLPIRIDGPRLKEQIFIISRSRGIKCTVADGMVTSIRGNSVGGNDDMLQITAPISSGSSGSPVFDLNGRVVGVATAYWKTSQKFTFAVMSRHIAGLHNFAFLKAHSQWHPQVKKDPNAKWFVETEPADATVKILNIPQAFKQGIELTAGRYHIEVSKTGYQTYQDWVSCDSGETKKLKIYLSRAPTIDAQDLKSKWAELIQHLKAASVQMLEQITHINSHRTGA